MKKFLEEFKAFALKGNVMDMAIGVIIGGAFTAIVTSLTDNFITPIITMITTQTLISGKEWAGYASAFIGAVVNFFILALILFIMLKAVNKLMDLGKKPEAPAAPTTKKCPFCCTEIAIEAKRCPNCTSILDEAIAAEVNAAAK